MFNISIDDDIIKEVKLKQNSYIVPSIMWSDKIIEQLSKTHEVFEIFNGNWILFKRCR